MPDWFEDRDESDLSEEESQRNETVTIAFNSAINILKEAEVSYVLITAAYLGELTATKIANGINNDNIYERIAITKIFKGL